MGSKTALAGWAASRVQIPCISVDPAILPQALDGMLSRRGNSAANPAQKQAIVEILGNVYDASTNPDGFVNLAIAENTLMQHHLVDFINNNFQMQATALTYGDSAAGSKRLRAALARFLNRHLHPVKAIAPEHIKVTDGVTSCLEGLGFALGEPGDVFLLGRPHYGSFPHDLSKRANIGVATVSFGNLDPMSLQAVDRYEEELLRHQSLGLPRVRALLLTSPHNPLGRAYPVAVLLAYMRLCQRYQIHLIADEVYALSTFDNHRHPGAVPFTSILAIQSGHIIDPSLLHVTWGLSKDFGANGLHAGCVISQSNDPLLRTFHCHSFPSSVVELVTSTILENDEWTSWYIATNRQLLADAHEFVASFLDSHQVPYAVTTNAGFFIWCNLGVVWSRARGRPDTSVDSNASIMQALLAEKLFLACGLTFGSEAPGWFRIVFTQPREVVALGLTRMMRALGA